MGGRHLLHVYNSSHAYRMKRLTAYMPMSVKRFGEGKNVHESDEHIHEERASSTAEEFRKVAEEKSHQASTTHTTEKAEDGTSDDSTSDSDIESVKRPDIGPTS